MVDLYRFKNFDYSIVENSDIYPGTKNGYKILCKEKVDEKGFGKVTKKKGGVSVEMQYCPKAEYDLILTFQQMVNEGVLTEKHANDLMSKIGAYGDEKYSSGVLDNNWKTF